MARILVVEDNPTNLQLMVYLLQAFGHATLEAMDGEAGLEAARREQPDLILCDVDLPKIDGLQVARTLKLDIRLRSIPLVAVTALAMVGDRDRMLQAGFDGYLSKPIQPREFVGQVEQFLAPEERREETSRRERDSPVAPPPSPPPPLSSSPHRGCVLVVDDTPANLQLARWILEPHGYTVVLCHSCKEALDMARRKRPDLILSDIHMPEGSGFELLAALRADPALRRVPFVFLSATYLGGADHQRALANGARAFLQRPISADTLLSEVTALIGKSREPGVSDD